MHSDRTTDRSANLCHNIAWLRRHYGLTKKEMAATIGLSVRSLSMIEKGVIPKSMGVIHLYAIAQVFGVSIRRLLGERMEEK